MPKGTDTLSKRIIIIAFPCNSGYANAHNCYVYTYIASLV